VRNFLSEGDKVKLTIMFRGREMVHQEYGRRLLDRMADELKELAIIERTPLVEGRNMVMILSPLAKKHPKTEPRSSNNSNSAHAARAAVPARPPRPATSGSETVAEDQNA